MATSGLFKLQPRRTMIELSLALLAFSNAATASAPDLDTETRTRVIESISAELAASYVFPEVAAECSEHLKAKLAAGKFDAIEYRQAFATALTDALQGVSQDKHMRVMYQPQQAEVQQEDPWLARFQQVEQMRERNFGFQRLERLDQNIGYLDLRSFADANYGRKVAAASMEFLSNCDAIIFDVRNNGGGSPEMVQFLCSYLFAERTHLNSLYFRPTDRTDEYWTLDELPGKRMPDVPVFVLTSSRTFSAAEEFSYNLQTQGRAVLVGATTGGGANPGGTLPIGDGFRMFVPTGRAINPITGTNWEGVGVVPEIAVETDKALDAAMKEARVAARDFREYKAAGLLEFWTEFRADLASAEASFEEGDLESGTRRIEAALEYGLELDLFNSPSIRAMGTDSVQNESQAAGLAMLRFNVKVHPQDAEAWNALGEAQVHVGQGSKARTSFETCLRLQPSHANALSQLRALTEK